MVYDVPHASDGWRRRYSGARFAGGVWWNEELRNKNGWFLTSMPIYIQDVAGEIV
jgi:hypothetical protein